MATVSTAQPAADSYAHGERIGFGLLLLGAPLLLLGAAFLHPPHGIESGSQYYAAAHDHSTRFYISHTLFFLAAVLFVPAIVGFARLVHAKRPKAAFWGGVLSLMGFVGYGAMDGMDYMTWVAGNPDNGLDPKTMQGYIDAALASEAIIGPTMAVFTLLVIGLVILAVGANRAGVLPAWQAAFMPIGMLGIAGFLEYPIPLTISALLLLGSFGVIGVKLLRSPNADLSVARAPL